MSPRTELRLHFSYHAILYALGLLFFCGIVPEWGRWYSFTLHHRAQTDAFLRGGLALSHNPGDLALDLCWSEGGVHQVWGLGIPLWRLPFETLARAFGQPAFPDRLELGLFMALVAYIVLSTWSIPALLRDSKPARQATDASSVGQGSVAPKKAEINWMQLVVAFGGVVLSLLFAPFMSVLRHQSSVWQEVLVFVHLFGVILMCGVITLARNPNWGRFVGLCTVAGLGGLVRPTLIFYGLGTVVMAGIVMVCSLPRPARFSGSTRTQMSMSSLNGRLLLGACLFILGGGLLFVTNRVRFGSGWEFGHSLNLNCEPSGVALYTTRFNYPFCQVPLTEAARELFGALFLASKSCNGTNWYAQEIFPGQSPTTRWRQFTFGTYDLSYLICIGPAWILGVWLTWKWLSSVARDFAKSGCVGCGLPPVCALLIGWSLLASVPLAVFYLRTPVIADRYMLDFSPAFAAALLGLWWWMVEDVTRRTVFSQWILAVFCLILVAWQGSEIALGKVESGRLGSQTWKEVLEREHTLLGIEGHELLPTEYRVGNFSNLWRIPYNCSGWDETNGRLSVSAIFFVENAEFLELELAPALGEGMEDTSVTDIRAKVGLEFLDRQSVIRTKNGWIVRFIGPKQHRYQRGVQPVFLATVSPIVLAKFVGTPTPWILKRLSWRAEQK